MTLLATVNNTINSFLNKVLDEGEQIQVRLYGFTDGLGFKPNSLYSGFEGSFPKSRSEYDFEIQNYFNNGEQIEIQLDKGDNMTNSILGFLRAFNMYDENLKFNLKLKKKLRKTHYVFHSVSTALERGGNYRKVGVGIQVYNIEGGSVIPLPVEPANTCDNILYVLVLLFSVCGSLLIHYARKLTEYKEDKSDSEKRYYYFRLVWAFVICIVLFFIMYLICPDFLSRLKI